MALETEEGRLKQIHIQPSHNGPPPLPTKKNMGFFTPPSLTAEIPMMEKEEKYHNNPMKHELTLDTYLPYLTPLPMKRNDITSLLSSIPT